VARPASLLFPLIFPARTMEFHEMIQLFLALHGVALVIVNMTPTPKDNEALRSIYKVLELFAGIGPIAKR
jgi:hypothetical protein